MSRSRSFFKTRFPISFEIISFEWKFLISDSISSTIFSSIDVDIFLLIQALIKPLRKLHDENIKQEAKSDNQYPVYYPLYEDIEKYVQELDKRKLASRLAYVVSKQRKATLIKTIEVLDQCFNKNTLNKIKKESADNFGRPYNEVMKETRERYFSNNHKQNIVKEFEPV